MSNKRLLMLEKMTQGGSKDPFHWYALGLEYAGLNRIDEALQTFTALRALDPDYVPSYLMCGSMLAKASRSDEARTWLTSGINVARKKGDGHALSELETALAGLNAV